jgi:hypothetical protein
MVDEIIGCSLGKFALATLEVDLQLASGLGLPAIRGFPHVS